MFSTRGQQVFANAIRRGEWPEDYYQAAGVGELVGPVLARYFLLQEAVTPRMIEERIQTVLALR